MCSSCDLKYTIKRHNNLTYLENRINSQIPKTISEALSENPLSLVAAINFIKEANLYYIIKKKKQQQHTT